MSGVRLSIVAGLILSCGGGDPAPPPPLQAPPWPIGGVLERDGVAHCEEFARPCNHAVYLAVRDRGGAWQVLAEPLAQSASVPDAVVVPTEHEGVLWDVLWASDPKTQAHIFR